MGDADYCLFLFIFTFMFVRYEFLLWSYFFIDYYIYCLVVEMQCMFDFMKEHLELC